MKRKTFIENLREQFQKIKAYKISKSTGITYEQALAEVQAENK